MAVTWPRPQPTPAVLRARDIGYRIRRDVRSGFDADYEGACGLVSAMMCYELGRPDLLVYGQFLKHQHNQLMRSLDHCWVELDGFIIDATATQFGWYAAVHVERADDTVNYLVKMRGIDVCREVRGWYYDDPKSTRFFRRFIRQCREFDDGQRQAG